LRDLLAGWSMTPVVSTMLPQAPDDTLTAHVRCARLLGAPFVRVGLSPVLEGARAAWGDRWEEIVRHVSATLRREAPRAANAGVAIVIENHQDFGSEELLAMCDAAGPNVGIVLDTGNPFAVGEDPVAFARRASRRIRHVHLKDYRAQFTEQGVRLVRCAIGDGAVPFQEIETVLGESHDALTASLEPGALNARHIRLFTPDWWRGYPPRDASELATALGRLRATRLPDAEPYETPWERGAPPQEIVDYEMAQVRRSAANMRQSHAEPAALRPAGERSVSK